MEQSTHIISQSLKMGNLSEDIQCASSDTRPPMFNRTDFDSWQQRIRLYCKGKDNGENILKSIDEGLFQMGKFHETLAEGSEGALHLDPEQDRVFTYLLPKEQERSKADIRATNILLQGFPKDIYTLINHYTDAKDIWDNVKMLLEGSELTKDDHESQLYDEFEHFYQNKGETIHEYYVRFTKLINDMRNIKMTMPKMQLNSKFVNNMFPDWGRFITAVKLNRGLKESNYDQLYAYLKQHQAHANENKMILERFTQHASDPLALMYNVTTHQYPSQSSAIPQPHQQNRAQRNNARGAVTPSNRGVQKVRVVAPGNEGVQNRVGNATPGQARWTNNAFDDDVDEPPVQNLALTVDNVFQADQCDSFDSDVDEALTTQTMFMANLSSSDPIYNKAGLSYDLDILSEVQDYDNYQDAVCEHHEVHEMHNDVQPNYVVDSDVEHTSDSNMILIKIAETTRKKMNEKMKDPMCVEKKVKIIPPEYSKENYLATCTPQKQLTPEQIFWSDDILKEKAKALKAKANDPKTITTMMVYPPNTPAKLFPRFFQQKIK
ncbi:hypothetical protein Tco_0121328 [Tanacetum coccineum]